MVMRIHKKGAGRPSIHPSELPVYDSITACSAATKVPLIALKHAVKNGCRCVRHGRVHFDEFIEWFFNRPKEDGKDNEDREDWGQRDKRAAAMLKEINVEERLDKLIDFAMTKKFLSKLVRNNFFGELERLAQEFPATLKGKDEVGIREEVEVQIERVRQELRRTIENWDTKKGKIE